MQQEIDALIDQAKIDITDTLETLKDGISKLIEFHRAGGTM